MSVCVCEVFLMGAASDCAEFLLSRLTVCTQSWRFTTACHEICTLDISFQIETYLLLSCADFNWPDRADGTLPKSVGFVSHIHLVKSSYETFAKRKVAKKKKNGFRLDEPFVYHIQSGPIRIFKPPVELGKRYDATKLWSKPVWSKVETSFPLRRARSSVLRSF